MGTKVTLASEAFNGFESWLEGMDRAALEDIVAGYPRHYQGIVLWTTWLVGTVGGGQVLHRVNEAQQQKVLDFGGEPLVKEGEA